MTSDFKENKFSKKLLSFTSQIGDLVKYYIGITKINFKHNLYIFF